VLSQHESLFINNSLDDQSSEDSIEVIFPVDPPYTPFEIPPTALKKIKWLLLLPIHVLYLLTIPDIRRKGLRKMYGLTFFMSMLWIGSTSYVLVWMAALVGFTFHIPDAVMGLTFIAFSASIPDAFASIAVVRQGEETV